MRRCVALRRPVASNFFRDPKATRSLPEARHEFVQSGHDLASGLSSDFVSLQAQLLKYRIVRLGSEVKHLLSNPADAIPHWTNAVLHGAGLYAMYHATAWYGRGQALNLVEPPKQETHN